MLNIHEVLNELSDMLIFLFFSTFILPFLFNITPPPPFCLYMFYIVNIVGQSIKTWKKWKINWNKKKMDWKSTLFQEIIPGKNQKGRGVVLFILQMVEITVWPAPWLILWYSLDIILFENMSYITSWQLK